MDHSYSMGATHSMRRPFLEEYESGLLFPKTRIRAQTNYDPINELQHLLVTRADRKNKPVRKWPSGFPGWRNKRGEVKK